VPEPCDFRLRVLDDETGKVFPIAAQRGWPPIWELDGHERGDASPEHLELQGDGSYAGQAPAGTIWIYVHADGYEASRSQHEIVRGTNEFVVSVARECGVELTLQDGEAVVPWPDGLVATLADSSGHAINRYRDDANPRVAAREPGELTLKIPDVAGFEPIAPRTVHVAHASWTQVAIALQRKR
ncbi:MAG TPA: hypothetical protein VFV95_21610, partial [Vicinamibacterales bacterium]|nr:hypothetical protein [Vicinamibacterales bacterium]